MQPRFLLATLALSATLALPVSDSGVRADSAPAQEVAQSEHHARVRRKAQATPDESMVLLSSIAQQFITKIATQNAVKPTSGGPDGLAAGGRGRGAGGGAGMRSQTNAIAKMVLGSLTAGQGQNSASVASQVLDAALDGLTDAQHGASTHAALVAQIMLAMFSTPDSQKIMSNPLSLKDPQVMKDLVASSLPLDGVQNAISKYLALSAPQIVAEISYPDGMSLAQFQAFEKAVTREIGVALSGNLVPDVLRGDGSYDAVAAKIVEAIGADAIANGVDPKAVAEWRASARTTMAHLANQTQQHLTHAASRVAAQTRTVADVTEDAAAVLGMISLGSGPSPAQVAQVLAGLMAAGGLLGQGEQGKASVAA